MTSSAHTRLAAILMIAMATLFLPGTVKASEPITDKRLDQLIDGCVKFVNTDPAKGNDGAEACEKVANTIKARAELHQKAVEAERSAKERERWECFGWPSLILFDLLLVASVGGILWATKGKVSAFLMDPDGKVSFSRVIGLFGATSIFVASALLLNVLLARLYIFNAVPEGIVSLFAPILTFVPTLLPYIFAKREEGAVARARARAHVRTLPPG